MSGPGESVTSSEWRGVHGRRRLWRPFSRDQPQGTHPTSSSDGSADASSFSAAAACGGGGRRTGRPRGERPALSLREAAFRHPVGGVRRHAPPPSHGHDPGGGEIRGAGGHAGGERPPRRWRLPCSSLLAEAPPQAEASPPSTAAALRCSWCVLRSARRRTALPRCHGAHTSLPLACSVRDTAPW